MLASKKCRTLAVFLFTALLAPATASAQFGPDQTYLGAHIGVSGVGSAAAIGVSAEVSYDENISIGGWLDTWSYGERFPSSVGAGQWDVRYVAIAGTGAYHFPVEADPKLDPFVGVALGYYIVSSSSSDAGFDYNGSSSRLFVGAYGGALFLQAGRSRYGARRLRVRLPHAGGGPQDVGGSAFRSSRSRPRSTGPESRTA